MKKNHSSYIHGMSYSKEHNTWKGIKARCYIESATGYKNYGGRGITVCKRWRIDFLNFFNDMGKCPEGFSLERTNNNKGYSKANCKWATKSEQVRNKRNTVKLTFKGESLIIPDWAKIIGIDANTLYRRRLRGWTTKEILTIKKGEKR